MTLARLLVLGALAVCKVLADVRLTYPAPGASVAAGTLSLQWQDSGAPPRLSSIAVADIVLCTGTDTNIVIAPHECRGSTDQCARSKHCIPSMVACR